MRGRDPENTIHGIKRILGRDFDSPQVRILEANSSFRIKAAQNNTPVLITPRDKIAPVQIATEIYRHLKKLAEKRFRAKIKYAVLTIPASATQRSEADTILAAKRAGFEVLRTIAEPSAGAVAFQLDRFRGQRKLLVYDFGGGTFDVTVIQQTDGELKPLTISGDDCLGGEDLDIALAKMISDYIWSTHKVDVTKDVVRWDRLLRESERVKRALSALENAPLRIRDAFASRHGGPKDIELPVHRNDVAPKWGPLISRTLQASANAVVKARLRPQDLDAILMIGGTTYVPQVRQAVAKTFARHGLGEGDPQTAVAAGAAIIGARTLAAA